jgi:hypothetical protein
MGEEKKYRTSTAFTTALETRLKAKAGSMERPYHTIRKLVAFDRLLARIFFNQDQSFALKGGYSLELRLGRSRTTQDVDLVLQNKQLLLPAESEQGQAIKGLLQEKLSTDLDDFFSFRLGKVTPLIAATIGGYRIQATALIGGRYFEEFHLDIAIAETDPTPLEELEGESWLDFANINQAKPLAIPQELQFAEKLHAYTYQREDRENSREKDLIDMVILIQRRLNPEITRQRVTSVFAARKTHELPAQLNSPPISWGKVFAKHAEELSYPGTMQDAFNTIQLFYSTHIRD